jgi:hypothetical protein
MPAKERAPSSIGVACATVAVLGADDASSWGMTDGAALPNVSALPDGAAVSDVTAVCSA